MSWFSPLFQSGTAFYGDPFPPIISVIDDFGWSLLPQIPGVGRPSTGAGPPSVPQGLPTPGLPPVPVAVINEGWGVESETTWVPPVLPGPEPARPVPVPREIVVVDDVATEVERHPEGDFPAGSIFAPGQTWGSPVHELDTDPYEDEDMAVDWGAGLDWVLDTVSGQQPWQTFGQQQPLPGVTNFAPTQVPPPSGIPGQPTTITGYSGGRAVTNGDTCGNRRYVTLDRETGKISCKRRRRRRLLTNRDLADLASLKTITGGGAALNAAVIRAVR